MIEPKSLKDIDWENDDVRLIMKSIAVRQQIFEKLMLDLVQKVMDSVKAVNAEVNSISVVTDSVVHERRIKFDTFLDDLFKEIEKSGVRH